MSYTSESPLVSGINLFEDTIYNTCPSPKKSHKTAYVAGAVLTAALLTFVVLGAAHGVFGKNAQVFLNQTMPHTWHHTIVPFVTSSPFEIALAAIGGSLATLAIVGIIIKRRKG